jgi:hypothetical protein
MEGLLSAIAVIALGGFATGIVLITMDQQREWKARRESKKK